MVALMYRGKHRAPERGRGDSIVDDLRVAQRELRDEVQVAEDLRAGGPAWFVQRLAREPGVLRLQQVEVDLLDPALLERHLREHNLTLEVDDGSQS